MKRSKAEVEKATTRMSEKISKSVTRGEYIGGLVCSLFSDAYRMDPRNAGNRRVPPKPTLEDMDSWGGRVVLDHTTKTLRFG